MKRIIYLGDSTVTWNHIATYPQTGLSQGLLWYLKDDVFVRSFAVNGRGTKSFIEQGRLQEAETFIQFHPPTDTAQPTDADAQFLLTFPDTTLWYRTVNVLRFTAGTRLVLFNKQVSVLCTFDQRTFERKNEVVVLVQQISINLPLTPRIVLMPSIVKRDTMVCSFLQHGVFCLYSCIRNLLYTMLLKWECLLCSPSLPKRLSESGEVQKRNQDYRV